jgi:hypothetical protein
VTSAHLRPAAEPQSVGTPVDVALGVVGMPFWIAARAVRPARPLITSGVRRAVRVSDRVSPRPAQLVDALARRGGAWRELLRAEVSQRLDQLVPEVVRRLAERAELTGVVRECVDLDQLVAGVDVEAVVARVDLDRAVARVDLDAAVQGLDVDAVVDRVDLDAVAQRLDIEAVLDRMDLTAVVLQRVDLEALITAILARMDLVGLAQEVIDGVDLPELIRGSTGSMASDGVREVRMHGIAADEAVGRAVDRLFLRRGRDRPAEPPVASERGPQPEA